jgi:hypothetical protein
MVDIQAKGSTTVLTFDTESTYKTERTAGSRYPRKLPYNSSDLRKTTPLNKSATLTGNRNPTQPYTGNKDVGGSITVPVDRFNFGYWLSMLFGHPTTTASTPSDIKTGSPAITVTSGIATLSVEQTGWAVGDEIVNSDSSVMYIGVINSTTECTVVDQYGEDTIVDITHASGITVSTIKHKLYTHVFKIGATTQIPSFLLETHDATQDIPLYELFKGLKIGGMSLQTTGSGDELVASFDIKGADYQKSSDVSILPANISITDGNATFTVAQTGASAGDMIIYGTSYSVGYITDVTETDYLTVVVKTTRGGSTNPTDVTTVPIQAILKNADYIGGGADELVTRNFSRYEMKHGEASEGGVSTELFRSITMNLNNDLDDSNFVIGGGGVRRSLPEGVAEVSGTLEVLVETDDILEKAENSTETTIQVQFSHPDDESSLTFDFNEVQYQAQSPTIPGPQGRILDISFQSYYEDNAQVSATTVTLVNTIPTYAV